MLLSQLLHSISALQKNAVGVRTEDLTTSLTSLTADSRKVEPGSLFIAVRGFEVDGHAFIADAIRKGATAIVCEVFPEEAISEQASGIEKNKIPVGVPPIFIVSDSRLALSKLAAEFYGHPSQKMTVIGVTGTNGKTTLTHLLEAFATAVGLKPAVLGTIEYRYGTRRIPATHTTPEAIELQHFLSEANQAGCHIAILEVSSHAIERFRVEDLHLDVAVFTNLTPEHLDYHKTMENYFETKARLFREILPKSLKTHKAAIFNAEDVWIQRLISESSQSVEIRTFATHPSLQKETKQQRLEAKKQPICTAPTESHFSIRGTEATVHTQNKTLHFTSRLLGRFNLANLMAALATAEFLDWNLDIICSSIASFQTVPGRLEKVPNEKGVEVFVDYAHTPDALTNVLSTLKGLLSDPKQKLHVVFGCGGDRDVKKRPLMAHEVARFANHAWVTSDNPRTENPQKIISEILVGFEQFGWKQNEHFNVEPDRKQAIRQAMEASKSGDILLIAGKGHENYQIIGHEKRPFDDREVVRKFLG